MAFSVLEYVPLATYVTLKTGGAARYFITVNSTHELKKAVTFAQQKSLPFFILGGGSNLLVADDGYEGVIIHMKIEGIEYEVIDKNEVLVTVGAGEILDKVIAKLAEKNLWGLENLSHIPGTVGATPVQNVGAYGVEVSDIIKEVTVLDVNTQEIKIINNSDCNFSYRHSCFKEKNNLVIVKVGFILSKITQPKISYADLAVRDFINPTTSMIRQAIIEIRSQKFPDWQTVGTAGSFFKNPILSKPQANELLLKYPSIPTYSAGDNQVKVSLGYILDKVCELKGFRVGLIHLYKNQALVLVADTGATTADIKNFVKIISDTVFEKTKINISPEVTYL